VRIKLVLSGKEHVADLADMLNKVTIGEVRTIKEKTGMTPAQLHKTLLEFKTANANDPEDENWDVYAALVYLLMSRSSGRIAWADVESIPLVDLAAGFSVIPAEDSPVVVPEQESAEIPLGELAVVNGKV
jgi:hypothetical protein